MKRKLQGRETRRSLGHVLQKRRARDERDLQEREKRRSLDRLLRKRTGNGKRDLQEREEGWSLGRLLEQWNCVGDVYRNLQERKEDFRLTPIPLALYRPLFNRCSFLALSQKHPYRCLSAPSPSQRQSTL